MKKGFSLIELMVVVAIIGLVITVATPYLLGTVDKTKAIVEVYDVR